MSYAGEPDDDSGSFFAGQGQLTPDSIQRQLALAAALQQQSQRINPGAYGGFNSAIQNIGGALLGMHAQNQQAQRYAQLLQSTLGSPQTTSSVAAPAIGAPTVTGSVGQAPVMPKGQIAPPPVNLTATPNNSQASAPTQTTGYSGPLGQALGANAPLYDALLHNMGSQQGTQLLSNLATRQMQHVHTLTPDEVQAAGLPAGGVYQSDSLGNIKTVAESQLKTSAQVAQEEQLLRDRLGIQAGAPLTREQQANLGLERGKLAEEQRHNRVEENIAQNPFGTPQAGAAAAAGMTGDQFLGTLNPGVAAQVKAVGTYRQAPMTRATPMGIKFMSLVDQAYPGYDATQFAAKNKARNDFATGKNGNTVRSLNVAVSHLDTLGQLSDALGNGDFQTVNRIGQAWNRETGQTAPTNFDAAKQIVGDEIVKAIIGTGGSQQDRDKAADSISRAASPQQLRGVINTYQQLLGGQLNGMRQQYQKTTGLNDFNDYLSPNTVTRIGHFGTAAPTGAKPTVSNW